MHACILGLARAPDAIDPDEVELETETNGDRGMVVERDEYLDGATIYSGTAAGYNETTETEIVVGDGFIETEQVEGREHVAADFYADFDAGWAGIDTSKATFVFDRLAGVAGTPFERATIDLDAFADDYDDSGEDAEVWQVARSEAEADPDSDDEGVQISYHDDATVHDAAQGGVSQLGISYHWGGDVYIYGTIAASGYVAIYSSLTEATFGRWLRDELLPYTRLPDTDASFLDEAAGDSEPDECEECGREPERDLQEVDGDWLCIVCRDAREDETEFEDEVEEKLDSLDSVTVAEGDDD